MCIRDRSFIINFFESFDITANFYRWLPEKERRDENLSVFDGIRVISMFWVVWGHTYMTRISTTGNFFDIQDLITSDFVAVAVGLMFSVDVFFFMGGFFFAFVFVKKLANSQLTIGTYLYTLFHRVLRIIPSYLMAILLFWKITPIFGNGPSWQVYVDGNNQTCSQGWWRDLTFSTNFEYSGDGGCMPQGWYLTVDMQIFLSAPILVGIYLATISSIVYSSWLSYKYKWGSLAYLKPWTRAPAYLIGILAAIFYNELKSSKDNVSKLTKFVRESRIAQLVISVSGIMLMGWIIYGVEPAVKNPHAFSNLFNALYTSLSRPLFTIGLLLTLLPSLLGGGRTLKNILGNSFMSAIAKLTFAFYLLHWIFLNWKTYTARSSFFFTHRDVFIDTISTCCLALPLAIFVHLFVEIPFGNIEQKFFAQRRSKEN
eukprot:TRINITY_DN2977_c0_g1_i3.p1 TRINITY_DN2977_c0_g1~~TRINITY_DN2977_c0_g1_i3.p1  ORF type:complete len:428 (+),score=33.04 TRINITY_DN2977_c0_g1_i3:78-1361(+)